jgi:hypothetical protein
MDRSHGFSETSQRERPWPLGTGFREHSGSIQGKFRVHSGNIQEILHMQGTFSALGCEGRFPQLPSAMTSTVDHPLGPPSLCFPQLLSAVTSTVDHPLGSPSLCYPQLLSAVTSNADHPLGSPSLFLLYWHRKWKEEEKVRIGSGRLQPC